MDRLKTKHDMWVERGGALAECDVCGKPMTSIDADVCQMHELVPRGITTGNDEAQEASFVPEICVLVCPQCHNDIEAGGLGARETLFQINVIQYGYDAVQAALDGVQAKMHTRLTVTIPEWLKESEQDGKESE